MSEAATPTGAQSQGQQASPAGGNDNASTSDADLAAHLSAMIGDDEPPSNSDSIDAALGAEEEEQGSDEGPQSRQPEDATPEAPASDEQTADPVVTVKIDGETRQIKQSELIAGYQKGEAASKRFEEAAQLRKSVEQERAQTAQERAHLAEALQHYTQQLQAFQQSQEPNWAQLLEADPTEFQRQRFHFEQRQAQLQQAQAAQAHLMQLQQAESQQRMMQTLQEQQAKLLEALPEWRDSAKFKSEIGELRGALSKTGFSDSEIEGLTDHRMVIVARKAMLYDQMVAKQAQAGKQLGSKLEKLPPVRVERPGAGEISLTDGRTRAMRQLSKTASARDAAGLIESLL